MFGFRVGLFELVVREVEGPDPVQERWRTDELVRAVRSELILMVLFRVFVGPKARGENDGADHEVDE